VERARTPARALVLGTSPATARALVELGVDRVELVTPAAPVLAATRAARGETGAAPFEITIGSERGSLAASAPCDIVLSKLDDFWLGLARGAFHREFYALVRSRLAPGGVFVQAIALDAVGIREIESIVASLARELPQVSLRIHDRYLVLLATVDAQAEVPEPSAVARMQPWQVERWLAFRAPAESSDRAGTLDFRVPNYRVAGDISEATASALVALASGRPAMSRAPGAAGDPAPIQRPATHQPAPASRIPG
jgi:spermidine synthase